MINFLFHSMSRLTQAVVMLRGCTKSFEAERLRVGHTHDARIAAGSLFFAGASSMLGRGLQ